MYLLAIIEVSIPKVACPLQPSQRLRLFLYKIKVKKLTRDGKSPLHLHGHTALVSSAFCQFALSFLWKHSKHNSLNHYLSAAVSFLLNNYDS